jgi:hypothetical protein
MAADVVVINHHLFFADLAIRESGMAELLPSVRVVVFDEAHQLNETGIQFLGQQLATGQLLDFARDLLAAGLQQARGLCDWQALAGSVEAARANCVWRSACARRQPPALAGGRARRRGWRRLAAGAAAAAARPGGRGPPRWPPSASWRPTSRACTSAPACWPTAPSASARRSNPAWCAGSTSASRCCG